MVHRGHAIFDGGQPILDGAHVQAGLHLAQRIGDAGQVRILQVEDRFLKRSETTFQRRNIGKRLHVDAERCHRRFEVGETRLDWRQVYGRTVHHRHMGFERRQFRMQRCGAPLKIGKFVMGDPHMVRCALHITLDLAKRFSNRTQVNFGLGQLTNGGFKTGQPVTQAVDIRHAQRRERRRQGLQTDGHAFVVCLALGIQPFRKFGEARLHLAKITANRLKIRHRHVEIFECQFKPGKTAMDRSQINFRHFRKCRHFLWL